MTNYTSVTVMPPGQMTGLQSILVGGVEIAANSDGSFTILSCPSTLLASYAGQGWMITAFTA